MLIKAFGGRKQYYGLAEEGSRKKYELQHSFMKCFSQDSCQHVNDCQLKIRIIVPDNSSSKVQMLHNIKVLLHGSIPITTKEVRRKWSYTGAYYFHPLLMTERHKKGTNMWI
jgi:hypothetical protein